ncbi:hypothetical protein DIJ64_10980 [Mycobacterium leprae]|uniref:Uncharacterized protein n=1 Tax=Mycobacterium leprae TaxID=1769 RepID=A0AAD0KXH3_MYCLR|nr:hypothetical protein DIJ64_10980 [Mycobacterium leprae]OAR20801.1 hypothetical protein A8144_02010 [Mycobacterium leprae 3125609]OAX72004.1 hypothetical protein A3216_02090 [Mycobacterium leprae 7935681]
MHRPARALEDDVATGWVGSRRLRTNRVVASSSSTDGDVHAIYTATHKREIENFLIGGQVP